MADVVDTLDAWSGKDLLIRRITNISDGTGETSVAKVVKSGLVATNGAAPTKLAIEELWWSIQGFSSIRFFWDHTTPDELAILAAGNGFRPMGGLRGVNGMLVDPASAGGTGNVILSTAGAVAGATYDITMVLRLLP